MLRPSKDLQDLAIVARDDSTDDDIGDVKDLFFDDEAWAIRYLVVETGSSLFSRKVLISPIAAGKPRAERSVTVDLTREALKQAPWYDPTSPLSREMEVAVFKHHGRAGYWPGAASAEVSASDRAMSSRAV